MARSLDDTLYTREAAMAAMAYDRGRALNIIDSAQIVGNVSDFLADVLRMKVYTQSLDGLQLDSAKALGLRLMQHDSVAIDAGYRLSVLDLLVSVSRIQSNDEELLRWTEQKAATCRELGNDVEALRTDVERSSALTRLGHFDEGMKQIDEVIAKLDGIRRFNEMDTWIIAVRRKINILDQVPGSNGQIITLTHRMLSRLEDFAQHPVVYHDGCLREPSDNDRPAYIEFYQSKCYAYLADAYVESDPAAARRYLLRYGQTRSGQSFHGRMMIAPILCQLGEYGQMEEIYREYDAQSDKDSLNDTYLAMLHDRAVAAEAQGRTSDAMHLWKRYDVLRGQMAERTISSKAHLYATSYLTEEQQKELEEEQTRRARTVLLAWALGVLAFLFIINVLYSRFGRKRKQEEPAEPQEAPVAPVAPAKRPSAMTDEELFLYISDLIRKEQLYLNPMLDRQSLIKFLDVSAHRIGAAFSKGSEFGSLPGFVRSLRLEHACNLLATRPDLSVKAVGVASGFSNNSTFCSDFKSRYGITPSEYRKKKPSDI